MQSRKQHFGAGHPSAVLQVHPGVAKACEPLGRRRVRITTVLGARDPERRKTALDVRIQSSGTVPSLWGPEGQPMPAHVTADAPRGLAAPPTQDRTGLSRAEHNSTKGSVSSFIQSSLLVVSFMCLHLLESLIHLGLFINAKK